MNQHTLTRREAATLLSLIAYGRGTAASMARTLNLDRRTCQRLTSPEGLTDLLALIKPQRRDLGTWYALLYSNWHGWSDNEGGFHIEATTARQLRDQLADIAVENWGDLMEARMLEAWRRDRPPAGGAPLAELRRSLERGFYIPNSVERFYHYRYPTPPAPPKDPPR